MDHEAIAAAKAELRRAARLRRDALDEAHRLDGSARVCAHLAPLVAGAEAVMAFVAMGSEVDLAAIGPTVLPRVEGPDLVPVAWGPGQELARSRFGVLEPTGPGLDPHRIDVVCVPGLAFDRHGYRVGYGKGFYDRFLPRLRPDAVVVGVCFAAQVVDEVPHDTFDVPVPRLVTEQGAVTMLRVGGRSAP